MRDYWLSDNREYAEQNVLHMVIGYVGYCKDNDVPVTAEEILRFIEDSLQKEEARLDVRFPQKAREYAENLSAEHYGLN